MKSIELCRALLLPAAVFQAVIVGGAWRGQTRKGNELLGHRRHLRRCHGIGARCGLAHGFEEPSGLFCERGIACHRRELILPQIEILAG